MVILMPLEVMVTIVFLMTKLLMVVVEADHSDMLILQEEVLAVAESETVGQEGQEVKDIMEEQDMILDILTVRVEEVEA